MNLCVRDIRLSSGAISYSPARIEAGTTLGDILTQNAIRADDLGPLGTAAAHRRRLIDIDDEKMIANGIIGIFVAPAELRQATRNRGHLLVEDLIAQPLRELYLGPRPRQADLEIADAAVDLRLDVAGECLQSARRSPKRFQRRQSSRKFYRQTSAPLAAIRNRLPHSQGIPA